MTTPTLLQPKEEVILQRGDHKIKIRLSPDGYCYQLWSPESLGYAWINLPQSVEVCEDQIKKYRI